MKNSDDNWSQCPKGQVGGLVGTLRQAKQRKVTRRRAIVAVASLALMAGFFLIRGGVDSVDAAVQPISCRDVRSHTQDILAGTLDESLAARVKAHLGYCGSCVRHVDKARDDAEPNSSSGVSVAAL